MCLFQKSLLRRTRNSSPAPRAIPSGLISSWPSWLSAVVMWSIGRARAVCQRWIESGKSLPQVRKDSITGGWWPTARAEFAELAGVAGVGDAEVDAGRRAVQQQPGAAGAAAAPSIASSGDGEDGRGDGPGFRQAAIRAFFSRAGPCPSNTSAGAYARNSEETDRDSGCCCNGGCDCRPRPARAGRRGAEPAPFGHACSAAERRPLLPDAPTSAARVPSFDGVPLDVDVTLPEKGSGPFPTIVMLHGFGGSKKDFESTLARKARRPKKPAAARRSTTTTTTSTPSRATRSSTTPPAASATPAAAAPPATTPAPAAAGYIRLSDTRYEARDTQYLLGLLADEGLVKPRDIGVTGISYGGGQSMELAFLADKIRLPNGKLVPWRSPKGKKMRIAAAYPRWPWSDLVSALIPNGRFLDNQVAPARTEPEAVRGADLQLPQRPLPERRPQRLLLRRRAGLDARAPTRRRTSPRTRPTSTPASRSRPQRRRR